MEKSKLAVGCDVINLILGAFLFISPWLFAFAPGAESWNAWIAGAVIAILSIAALSAFAEWEEWLNLIVDVPGSEPTALKRSYSIASAPASSPRFSIAVTHVQGGPGSTTLHAMKEGATLSCIGPQGFFTRAANSTLPSLLIATGTGVTPMRSMLQAALAAGPLPAPMWLLFGARREVDVIYSGEMEALARRDPAFRFMPTLSQPSEAWVGLRGYVQTHIQELWAELSSLGGAPHAYICGLERMVGSVREILRTELGLPRQQVHSERYD